MGVETAFQQAIYNALTGDTPFVTACPNIRDTGLQVDNGATGYPYALIGETIFTVDDSDGVLGFSGLLRLHIYTATGAMSACKQLQGLAYDVLHRGTLSMTGFSCYMLAREDTQTMALPDGVAHGVCEYRALIEKT